MEDCCSVEVAGGGPRDQADEIGLGVVMGAEAGVGVDDFVVGSEVVEGETLLIERLGGDDCVDDYSDDRDMQMNSEGKLVEREGMQVTSR